MPNSRKVISVRLSDSQYELVSRLAALTGKSRNAFFQEVMDNSEPALRQMMEVLDQANRYRNAGARVGKVISIAAKEASAVQGLLAQELATLSDRDSDDQAPPL